MAFRDSSIGERRLPLSWAAAAATLVAALVALGLLMTDRRHAPDGTGYGAPRSEFDELMEPVAGVVAAPVRWTGEAVDYVRGYFFAASENRRLKREIVDLQRWKDAAVALKSINDRYEALLKLRTEPPIPSVAARVILDARGPFSNARLADAGTERGVKVGDPVLSQRGVVGRVVGVTKGASRILLLSDVDSRTPVMVDRTNARGILIGDGGEYPRLDYVRGQDPVRAGDLLLTSGDGGVYPRGLPVGIVSKDLKGAWRARLHASSALIDYVRILSFSDFSQGVDPKSLAPGAAIPPLTPDEQRSLQAALAVPQAAPATPPVGAAAKPASPSPQGAASGASAAEAPAPAKPNAPVAPRALGEPTPAAAAAAPRSRPKPKVRAASPATARPNTSAKPRLPVRPKRPRSDMDGLL